jgi:ketosteroid isomerase-like protein
MSDTNIARVKGFYAAFGKGEIGHILSSLAPDVEWQSYGNPQHFPTLGPRTGIAEVEAFFRQVGENIAFSEFDPQEFFASGDHVFVLGRFAGTVRGTGRPAAAHFAHVFTFDNGKVGRFREYVDTASFAEAYTGVSLCKA